MFRKILALILVPAMVLSPAASMAEPYIRGIKGDIPAAVAVPVNALPVPTHVNLRGVSSFTVDDTTNKLTVEQNEPQAVINWKSFDIGEQAWTHFDQQGNKDWAALNRIHDLNPSRIMGKLSADGKIYLLNQNGILFGPGSQVNVHALTATTLNSTDEDFLNGLNKFKAEDYVGGSGQAPSGAFVVNEGRISTDDLGSVFLLGQSVSNSGTIESPVGQIGLAAGSEVEITIDSSGNRSARMVKVTGEIGEAVSTEAGRLLSDTGLVGMYGREIRQDGEIRAVTAIRKSGQIELFATDRISTGPNSIMTTPVSDSRETAHESFEYQPGSIRLSGLDPTSPGFPHTEVKRVEHRGAIAAPSGNVTIDAAERVFLDAGSSIDVSGAWVDKPASARVIDVQLNSVNLKDDYGQKDGILRGGNVQIEMHKGTAIGDIAGSLQSQELTAMERSTAGGFIFITSSAGDIVLKPDAGITFAGGGVRYAQGSILTTTLVSGHKFYSIADAPQWLRYDGFMDVSTVTHRRFGIRDVYTGLYAGGAVPLKQPVGSLVQGDDAGSVQLMAPQVYLDGILDGSVTRGFYQTLGSEPSDEFGYQTAMGWEEPLDGALIIGDPPSAQSPELIDFVTHAVRISKDPLAVSGDMGMDDRLTDPSQPQETVLSAAILNGAGLGRLNIYANTTLRMDEDAALSLLAGGAFVGSARRIEQAGEISVRGGSITLSTGDNITALQSLFGNPNDRYIPLDSRIFAGAGSILNASGQRIDNSLKGEVLKESLGFAHIHGGAVSLLENTSLGEGVIMARGALVDVSGGYGIDEQGKLSKGSAGSLQLMGSALAVEGDLRGHSIIGSQGGTFFAHAENTRVSFAAPALPDGLDADTPLPSDFKDTFLMAQDLLKDTGFTQIELRSANDLVVDPGVSLAPSVLKFAEPLPAAGTAQGSVKGGGDAPRPDRVAASADLLGKTSFKASAGVVRAVTGGGGLANLEARVLLGEGAAVETAPGGQIALEGPGIKLDGRLLAPAGKITLKATVDDVAVLEGALLSAAGFNKPDAKPVNRKTPLGYTPMAGGAISLQASNGSVILEEGSLLDVSGSQAVPVVAKSVAGHSHVSLTGSAAGTISLAFLDALAINGELSGHAGSPGVGGGAVTVSMLDQQRALEVQASDLDRFTANGFDVLTLRSLSGVQLKGSIGTESTPFEIARSLTIDAPRLIGFENDAIHIASPWITLTSTFWPDGGSVSAGGALLDLSGEWLDVVGSVKLSGFGDVRLSADRDLRLADRLYTREGSTSVWQGVLETAGRLSLDAERIYPTTLSRFGIRAGESITTLGGVDGAARPIYSAGGSLTLEAPLIHHQGFLAAPMGSLDLLGTGGESRIYLAQGSVLSTAGSTSVNYGSLDNSFWTIQDKGALLSREVDEAPVKSIDLQAGEIIAREGSLLDASGGGEIFAYQFLPGIDGSANPLEKSGRCVILPHDPTPIPGETVYLSGSGLVPEGTYTLLPAQFAFVPGAVVVTDTGTKVAPGEKRATAEGYPMVSGVVTVPGSDAQPGVMRGYSLRTAEKVLKEGDFTVASFEAGDGGRMSIQSATTLFSGGVRARGLEGFAGGALTMSARNISVQEAGVPLPVDFDFQSPVPDDLAGKLFVSGSSLSGGGLGELVLGDSATETIILREGSVLESSMVSLYALQEILLESGARILALSDTGGGEAGLFAPEGRLILEEGATVHASDTVHLDMKSFDLRGELLVDNSTLNLTGEKIFFVGEGFTETEPGLYLTESLWGQFASFENVTLKSATDIIFSGDFDLSVESLLTLDASRIAAADVVDGAGEVHLAAARIDLLNNSGKTSSEAGLLDSGSLLLDAGEIVLGSGEVLLDGFQTVALNSVRDLTMTGRGGLTTGGDLSIQAARVTTSFYSDDDTPYTAADYHIDAQAGRLALTSSGGLAGPGVTPGGALTLSALTIDQAALIDMRSGRLSLNALGPAGGGDLVLRSGSEIRVTGTDSAPGGTVSLSALNGSVSMESGSRIGLAAGKQGDAGSLTISSPQGEALLDGELAAHGAGGRGGSFGLDTRSLTSFSGLASRLTAGGFGETIDLRVRQGNVTVGAADRLEARRFALAVDSGSLDVLGAMVVSGGSGGRISLYAGGDLTLHDGSVLKASGIGPNSGGGRISLGSATGYLNLLAGSTVDLSGGAAGGGGTLHLRALRDAEEVKMNLDGAILGPLEVLAEAVRVYDYTGARNLGAADLTGLKSDTEAFMAHASSIEARLLVGLETDGWGDAALHLLPGLELRSTGDMTLGSAWDLTSWRFAGEPGVVTLRAGGHLTLKADLVDHPTPLGVGSSLNDEGLFSTTARSSWALSLVAGADFAAADVLDVGTGAWDFKIDNGKQVYTESGGIRFASARDTLLGPSAQAVYMNYAGIGGSLATYAGAVEGTIGRNLQISGGAIQTAVGDIELTVGGDLVLAIASQSTGSIRTLGESPNGKRSNEPGDTKVAGVSQYWYYAGGGDVTLRVGGAVNGNVNQDSSADRQAWDYAYGVRSPRRWAASYQGRDATEGIAAMGGGSVLVTTGGDFKAQSGTFGTGDFTLYSGGDVEGRFLVKEGDGHIQAMGNFGGGRFLGSVLEAFSAGYVVGAQGDVEVAAILNPTIARKGFSSSVEWELGYSQDAFVKLSSASADVTLLGDSPFHDLVASATPLERVLPSTLEISAGEDIRILNVFALAPSANGSLTLTAGGDIDGTYTDVSGAPLRGLIAMSDMDPAEVYGVHRGFQVGDLFSRYEHASTPLHGNDATGSLVQAGEDVVNLQLYMPESVLVSAGRDVRDIFLFGQNVRADDVSGVLAKGSILFSSALQANNDTGIEMAGPGALLVQAVDSIDLGTTRGIQSVGNTYNPLLDEDGSDVIVGAGFSRPLSSEWVTGFFAGVRATGKEYSELLSSGDLEGARSVIERFRGEVIEPSFILSDLDSPGRVNMTTSQISTTSGKSDIHVLTAGDLNVGKSSFFSDEQQRQGTGIYTASGGAVNIFSFGDINVNESRVMTFRGGDITLWSDGGDINAGRGSKTAVSATPPKLTKVGDLFVLIFNPPALGSGVRAVTYDPDGIEGPLVEPAAGDVYLFAPGGIIDAGEAGIAGTNVFLGATQVINVENISFTAGSVGVPSSSDAGASLGALSGATSLSEGIKDVQQSTSMASNRNGGGLDRSATEGFMTKWLEVRVLSFDIEDPAATEEES